AAEETWRQDALAAGAEDYFIKDSDIPELIEAVQKLNGEKQTETLAPEEGLKPWYV
ncbi:MAG: hypothetical protein GTO63_19485, partial [Anaerolineae bacterium]|nr:hypothetical protein [Anaerolineae bacterium]NIN96957.1 hypothetical protein [Anaerolineae bacterium]